MSTSTFSILFWIQQSRIKNGQCKIYARITVNGRRANLSLKYTVEPKLWDSSKSKVKGNSAKSREINQYLDQVKSGIFNSFKDLQYEGKLITAPLIKARYLGLDLETHTLSELIQFYNDDSKSKISSRTYGYYLTTQKYIVEYISTKYKSTDLHLQQLDFKFITGFEAFLRNYIPKPGYKSIGNNSAIKHIQRLNKIIGFAIKLEWLDKNPFSSFQFSFEKSTRTFLDLDELQAIENYNTNIERLSIVKDLYVFSCYTGLAYIDIMNLTQDNVVLGIDGGYWITTKRQKTNIEVKVPLLPSAENIINKYRLHVRIIGANKLLPTISNQKLNSYLKELADHCGITKNLTFHMARHTFATTVTLTNGVPIESVSKMLGHTKLTTTQIYAKILDKKVSEDMNILKSKFLDNVQSNNKLAK
ncbi:site-specific integrase [Algibacter mikhailovii]|uniref:site-specific integrase n=1 Tax=Algibacter mikhailovii TaxID=425498 RepID=UPI0024952699|nr:site-specific integrase [Algibacter mikhailovii]